MINISIIDLILVLRKNKKYLIGLENAARETYSNYKNEVLRELLEEIRKEIENPLNKTIIDKLELKVLEDTVQDLINQKETK